MCMKDKGSRVAETGLKKEDRRGIHLSDFKPYCIATVVKAVVLAEEQTRINGTE